MILASLSAAGCGADPEGAVERAEDSQSAIVCAPPQDGLRLWLRADDLLLPDGGAVASWADASGQGSHASQATAGRRPTLVAAAVGGRAAVRFDGVDDRLDLALNTFAAGSFPITVIAVLRTNDADAHVVGTGSSSAGYLSTYGGALTLSGGSPTIKANNAGSGLLLGAGASAANGAPRVVAAVAQAGASALFVDGQLQGESTAATNAYGYGKSTIGASDGSSAQASRDPFAGDLAELIVHHRALSAAERSAVEQCLGARYGVPITLPPGCDGVPGSGLTRDACGVCGGDGSSCLDEAVVPDQLALWLRADDLALPDGAAVARWSDVSGQGAHASQATASRRPILDAGVIQGHAAVRFDGADDRLDLAVNTFAAASFPLTVFAVLKTTDASAHVAGTGSSSAGYLTTYGGGLTLVGGAPTLKANNAGYGLHLTAPSPIHDGAPRLVSGVARAGGSALSVGCAIEGLSGAATNAYGYGKSTLGASDGSSSDKVIDPFAGAIAELIVYRRALGDAEQAAIEDYLTGKYGLGTCVHAPPDPAITLTSSAVMFFRMNEAGPAPRADIARGLDVAPFPPDGAGISAVPAIQGLGQFVNGPGGYHFWRPSSPGMSHGGGSFTWAGWMKLASFYDSQTFVGKWNEDTGHNREYRIWYDLSSQQMRFQVSGTGGGAASETATAAHPAAIALDTFYFIEAWHDAVAGTVNLRVGTTADRGSVATVPWTGGVRVGSADLNIAAHNTCADDHLHGDIDAVGYWTRVLTEAESLRLWNGGVGYEP